MSTKVVIKVVLNSKNIPIKEYEVEDGDVLTVGRHPDNDIVVAEATVSRRHARLARQGNELAVWDLDSRNGIAVNGLKVQSAVLNHGDVVWISGRHNLRVQIKQKKPDGSTITAEHPAPGR